MLSYSKAWHFLGLSKRVRTKGLHSPAAFFSSLGPGKINLKGINLQQKPPNFDKSVNGKHFDVAVIGGGSGGLAFVLEAQKLGLNTVVFDYVEPSTQGTKWGLGGTCVNVGCIPKKLMHNAALIKEHILNSRDFGWDLDELNNEEAHEKDTLFKEFEWKTLVRNVQLHIKSINFEYTSTLKENGTPYVNNLASLLDRNTIVYSANRDYLKEFAQSGSFNGEKLGKLTADYIIIATGGRPRLLTEKECKNGEKYSITSDDIFSLQTPPNKTLVVGGGYIALECAGFLSTIGYPVTLMNRTDTFLRGFDTDMARLIINHLSQHAGTKVIPWTLPTSIEKENGKLYVTSKNRQNGKEEHDTFDTVLMAIGRTANTGNLNLNRVGVKMNPHNDKIIGGFDGEAEKTSVDNIYAIGDVLDRVPELTPVAQKSGSFLAKRLGMIMKGRKDAPEYKYYTMDYKDYPTTVFTPLEYSCVGYSEEQALEKFGEENIVVYHSRFLPLEEQLVSRTNSADGESRKVKAYIKIICDKADDERVVGIHYTGPNAGEVMQGYTVAMKLGLKKRDLDRTIGIHPTCAEEFVVLKKTKDENPDRTSC